MAVKKLLDENSLIAIKTYVDTYAGKVDDVKIQVDEGTATSILSNKVATIPVTSVYSGTSETIVNGKAIKAAIDGLDVSNISGFGAGKTLATLTETDGKIAATFQDIRITESQISDFGSYVPTSRTIAGVNLVDNITASELITALGLSQALTFVGTSTTDPTSTSGATVSGHSNWKKGDVVLYNNLEYVNTTGSNTSSTTPNPNWEELGDGASYALKTTTVTGTGALSGGGDLSTNRTITHAELNTSGAQGTAKVWKQTLDKYGHVLSATAATAADVGVSIDTTNKAITVGSNTLNVVDRSSNQLIAGQKTFSDVLTVGDSSTAQSVAPSIKFASPLTGTIKGTTTLKKADSVSTNTVTLPSATGTLALTNDITITSISVGGASLTPSNKVVSIATINNNYNASTNPLVTQSDLPSTSNFVTLSGDAQTITSAKTFNNSITMGLDGSTHKSYPIIFKVEGQSGVSHAVNLYGPAANATSTATTWYVDLPSQGTSSAHAVLATTSDLATHTGNSNIHVTSADKTAWNGKLKDVKVTEVTSATSGAGYQKLQQSTDGTTYTDIVSCLSYNEAWAILTASA